MGKKRGRYGKVSRWKRKLTKKQVKEKRKDRKREKEKGGKKAM